jgi:hypothetical protein
VFVAITQMKHLASCGCSVPEETIQTFPCRSYEPHVPDQRDSPELKLLAC